MKILHVNTNYGGGAGIAARRLNASLNQYSNIESDILFLDENSANYISYSSIENSFIFNFKNKLNRLKHKWKSGFSKFNPISLADNPFDVLKLDEVSKYDIIHLHWVSKFLDYKSFFEKVQQPVVWTIHDMAPFSDGFHYDFDFDIKQKQVVLRKNSMIKHKSLVRFENLTINSPSHWLMTQSSKSKLFSKFTHHNIRNTIDTSIFKTLNSDTLRKKYGVKTDEKVVLFLAENVDDKRKGIEYFKTIIPSLEKNNIKIILVGNGTFSYTSEQIISLGLIKDENVISEIYNVADAYVTCSMQDNFPNTILESLACGTPVVVFNNSGCIELIDHKINGYIAENKDTNSLLDGILYTLNELKTNKKDISKKIHELCSYSAISKKHIELYEQILSKKK